MQTTVIHHSADFDGLFCREIARRFLPDAKIIGWHFTDDPLAIPPEGPIYILDLPVDRVFGLKFGEEGHLPWLERVIWIDHHKSSIETHNPTIPGYRIDGVAACRLAWQWFRIRSTYTNKNGDLHRAEPESSLPNKALFVERRVPEPLAVRLAGEYDIWDRRDLRAFTFQYGLRSRELTPEIWHELLSDNQQVALDLLNAGAPFEAYQQRMDKATMARSFMVEFEGLKFIALNTARCNSLTFAAKDVPETGHDGLLAFYYDGKDWHFSLYKAGHRHDLDLSPIAKRLGGGGHAGACGFKSPFPPHTWRVL